MELRWPHSATPKQAKNNLDKTLSVGSDKYFIPTGIFINEFLFFFLKWLFGGRKENVKTCPKTLSIPVKEVTLQRTAQFNTVESHLDFLLTNPRDTVEHTIFRTGIVVSSVIFVLEVSCGLTMKSRLLCIKASARTIIPRRTWAGTAFSFSQHPSQLQALEGTFTDTHHHTLARLPTEEYTGCSVWTCTQCWL